jgi:hypothetical protein
MTSVLAPIYSARDTAITNRPTSTAILAIDSEDRFRDYPDARNVTDPLNRSPYNFVITKNQSLMNGFFTRLAVTEVVFPWTLPNINPSTATIICTVAATAIPAAEFQLELDVGFYTPSMIASALQTLVRNINPVTLGAFTMTYGVSSIGIPTTTQLPIFQYDTNNVPAGVTISFRPLTAADDPFFREPLRKQLFDLLGFSNANTVLAAQGYGAQTYCQFTRYVDIVCTQLTANQALKDTMSQVVARDVLARLYVNDAPSAQSTTLPSSSTFCPPGCMPTTIYRDYVTPKQIQWIPNQPVPGYLRFQVYDDAGFALSDYDYLASGNGSNWSMTLLVSEN